MFMFMKNLISYQRITVTHHRNEATEKQIQFYCFVFASVSIYYNTCIVVFICDKGNLDMEFITQHQMPSLYLISS